MRNCDSAYDRACVESEVWPGKDLEGGHYVCLEGGGVWAWGPGVKIQDAKHDIYGSHTLRFVGDWPDESKVVALLEEMGATDLDEEELDLFDWYYCDSTRGTCDSRNEAESKLIHAIRAGAIGDYEAVLPEGLGGLVQVEAGGEKYYYLDQDAADRDSDGAYAWSVCPHREED